MRIPLVIRGGGRTFAIHDHFLPRMGRDRFHCYSLKLLRSPPESRARQALFRPLLNVSGHLIPKTDPLDQNRSLVGWTMAPKRAHMGLKEDPLLPAQVNRRPTVGDHRHPDRHIGPPHADTAFKEPVFS